MDIPQKIVVNKAKKKKCGYEHLLQAEPPNYPADEGSYFITHGETSEMINNYDLMDVDLYYESKDAKKITTVEYYLKSVETAHYHGSLYIKKNVKGNDVYRKLLLMFVKRMDEARHREDRDLNKGIEIKKTFLFPTDFLLIPNSRCTAERIKHIGYTRIIDLSPVIVTRRAKSGGTKIEIQSNIVYEFDPEFPLLVKRPLQRS